MRLAAISKQEHIASSYVHVERTLDKIVPEVAAPVEERHSPREIALVRCADVALAIEIVRKIDQVGLRDDGAEMLAQSLGNESVPLDASDGWRSVLSAIRSEINHVAEYYADAPRQFLSFDLRDFANALAERADTHDTSLIIGFDQVDNLPPMLFDRLSRVVRSDAGFTSLLAARPFPFPPFSTDTSPLPGVNAKALWVGPGEDTDEWDIFLDSLLAKRAANSEQLAAMQLCYPQVLSLSFRSPRNLLRLLSETPEDLNGESGRAAVAVGLNALSADLWYEVQTVLGFRLEYPKRFINKVLDFARGAREGKGFGRVQFRFTSDDADRLTPLAKHSVALAVREGLFLPQSGLSATDWGQRDAGAYEINPLLVVGDELSEALDGFEDDEVTVSLGVKEVSEWADEAQPHFTTKEPDMKAVFVSHWFQRPEVFEGLRDLLHGQARVITGNKAQSAIHEDVFDRVTKEADRFVVDLTADRVECLTELGWAIASETPVIWTAHSDVGPHDLPGWAQAYEVVPHSAGEGMQQLAQRVVESLNSPPSAKQRWRSSSSRSLRAKVVPKRVVVLGTAESSDLMDVTSGAARSEGLPQPKFVDLADDSVASPLNEVIVAARSAALLVVHLTDDRSSNLLAIVGMGIFTKQRVFSRHRVLRRVIVVDHSSGGMPKFVQRVDERCRRFTDLRAARGALRDAVQNCSRA